MYVTSLKGKAFSRQRAVFCASWMGINFCLYTSQNLSGMKLQGVNSNRDVNFKTENTVFFSIIQLLVHILKSFVVKIGEMQGNSMFIVLMLKC